MEEINLNKIEWSAPEYDHEEKSNDWFWTIGLITLVSVIISLWLSNYIFAIFLAISGASLILFTLRHPQEVTYTIENEGLSMGKDKYEWKNIKSFYIIKKNKDNSKLLIETNKYFLPVYTIPMPTELTYEVKENLLKVLPSKELGESKSMLFMEKLGF